MGLENLEALLKVSQGKYHTLSEEALDELELSGLISSSPPESVYWQWDVLSKIFHRGTQNIGDPSPVSHEDWSQASLQHSLSVPLKSEDLYYRVEGPLIPLCVHEQPLREISLKDVLMKRKTSRQFSGLAASFEDLSTLLYYAFGKVHEDDAVSELYVGLRKTSPSTGGLHPTEAFVVVHRVTGLAPGVYHYSVEYNSLILLNKVLSSEDMRRLFYDQPFAEDSAFGIFLTSRLDLIWKKYPHSRSYRDALIDVGHVSQTSLLIATALELDTWECGLFHDQKVSEYVGINGQSFAPFFFLCFGPSIGPIF
jgi:SagB-type dehydrogenase family enzyme